MQTQSIEEGIYILDLPYKDLYNYIGIDGRLKVHEDHIWDMKMSLGLENGEDFTLWYKYGYTKLVIAHLAQEKDKDTLRECVCATVEGNQYHILKLIVKKNRTKHIFDDALIRASRGDRPEMYEYLNRSIKFSTKTINVSIYNIILELSGGQSANTRTLPVNLVSERIPITVTTPYSENSEDTPITVTTIDSMSFD